MSNNLNSDEKINKYLKDLSMDEKNNLYSIYQAYGEHFTSITRAMSDILFNWLFILNTGGLVAVITIFTSACDNLSLNKLFFMALCFLLGLVFIYIAARFEKTRFEKKIQALDNNYDLLKADQITVGSYCERISEETCPYYGYIISFIEILSFISFLGGATQGFFIIYMVN